MLYKNVPTITIKPNIEFDNRIKIIGGKPSKIIANYLYDVFGKKSIVLSDGLEVVMDRGDSKKNGRKS